MGETGESNKVLIKSYGMRIETIILLLLMVLNVQEI